MIWYISTYISHISVAEHVIGTFIHTSPFPVCSKLYVNTVLEHMKEPKQIKANI